MCDSKHSSIKNVWQYHFSGMSNISNAGYPNGQIELNLHQLHVYNKGFVVEIL